MTNKKKLASLLKRGHLEMNEESRKIMRDFERLDSDSLKKSIREAKEDIKAGRTKSLREVFGRKRPLS